MEQSFAKSILVKLGISIAILAFVDLVYLNFVVFQQNQSANVEEQKVADDRKIATSSPVSEPSATPTSAKEIKTETVVNNTVVEREIVVQSAQKEIFIPIGTGSTFSHDYVDLAGLEVSIDTTKYAAIDSVVYEASVRVQDGNGKMYTQLFNKTDGHPVWNSEITTISATNELKVSSKINLDAGNKTYVVQAKTDLTSYAAHVSNARIKIILK